MDNFYKRDECSISDIMKLRFNPLVADRGEGIYIYDIKDKRYIDFSSNWGVVNTGYSHPKVNYAIKNQLEKLSFISTITIINEESIILAEKLKKLTPGNFKKKVWFGLSGSDANEMIYKAISVDNKKNKIISFTGSYHGQSIGSYSMSGHPMQKKSYASNVIKIPYPYCYRCPFSKEEKSCERECLKFIKDYLLNLAYSPDSIGALIAETIQCDGGVVPMPYGYLENLYNILKKNGIFLIIDEVKIGFGRTGYFFSYEKQKIIPDAVVMGKSIASGLPLSAVVGRREILDKEEGLHLFTTSGSPISARASIATILVINEEKLVENSSEMGRILMESLNDLLKKFDQIGDVRGRGLVVGIEIVKDKKSKIPDAKLAAMISYNCYEKGLILYPVGIFSNVLEITPPLIINKEEIYEAVSILESAIYECIKGDFDASKLENFCGWAL